MTMRMENMMKMMLKSGSLLVLASLVACGGGGGSSSSSGGGTSSSHATKLVYTDPTPSGTQWALMKDGASTDKHLILDLVSPSDAVSGFGVGFTINAPTGVTWSKVTGTDATLIQNTAYTLGGTSPQLIKGVSKSGNLIAGVFQKGLATTAVPHPGTVAKIALDLNSGASKAASATLIVSVSQELQASGMQNITIVPGTLSLQ
jgi:hypothetical protein